jgi:hypothetical protein
MRNLMQRALLAVAALIGGVLVTIAPAPAQPRVYTENVTQIRVPWGQFDRTGKTSWVGKKIDGTSANYVEDASSTDNVLFLKGPSAGWGINFHIMQIYEWADGGINNPVAVKDITFDDCNLPTLRPLQGAAGMGEVAKKTKDIGQEFDKELADLKNSPIKIIRGLGGDWFVIDHHHGALAWIAAQKTSGKGICKVVNFNPSEPFSAEDPEKFWAQLKANGWVRLNNEKGDPIAEGELPTPLEALRKKDDPYRTLAWMVRKADSDGFNSKSTPKLSPGFCRKYMNAGTDFAEFKWADAMREKGRIQGDLFATNVTKATDPKLWDGKKADRLKVQVPVLTAALAFAKSDEAVGLPGWRGDKKYEGKDQCPPDPVE